MYSDRRTPPLSGYTDERCSQLALALIKLKFSNKPTREKSIIRFPAEPDTFWYIYGQLKALRKKVVDAHKSGKGSLNNLPKCFQYNEMLKEVSNNPKIELRNLQVTLAIVSV